MSAYFYDKQIRRYLIQFARIFSNFQVEKGIDAKGNPIVVRVPVQQGDMSRQVAQILQDSTVNKMPTAPLFSYYITGIEYDRSRIQEPMFIDDVVIRQRKLDPETKQYTSLPGDSFTLSRIMPVPYVMQVTLDFWATSIDQKLQIIEQIAPLFNPALEIQSSDSIVDWTSLTNVFLENMTYTSKQVPAGTNNQIDVVSWKFTVPIWLTSAAKLRKSGFIQKIIVNIFEGNKLTDMSDDAILFGTRQKVTPYGYKYLLVGNTLQLLPENQPEPDTFGVPDSPDTNLLWSAFLNAYGTVEPDVSQIRLFNEKTNSDIVGTIKFNPNDDRLLHLEFDPDTLPTDTIAPIDSAIDPMVKAPGIGLPLAQAGQRYLILNDVASSNPAWGGLSAVANSVIEFDGTIWNKSFDASSDNSVQYVTNLKNLVQYHYNGTDWVKSIEGWYKSGDLSIIL